MATTRRVTRPGVWTRLSQPQQIFFAAAFAIGCLLRLREYLTDRSLWLDEAYVALNVTRRPFSQLFDALAFDQAAPVGFMFAEKVATEVFGTSEYALRATSFVASIIGLAAFTLLALRVLGTAAAMIAVGLFALSDPAIRYASEVKPYGVDVCVATLVLLYMAPKLGSTRLTRRNALTMAAAGIAVVLFSYPASFVFLGCGAVLMVKAIAARDSGRVRGLCLAYGAWFVALIGYYLAIVHAESSNEAVIEDFQGNYWPLPPHSLSDATWLPRHLLFVFADPPGFVFVHPLIARQTLTVLAAVVFALGCVSLYRRSAGLLWMLLLPIAFALVASVGKKYVFGGRLLLFTIPALALLLGEGIAALLSRARRPLVAAVAIGALAVVFAQPLTAAGKHLAKQRTVEELRPGLTYLRTHQRPGDHIYVYYYSQFAYKYYASRFGFGASVARAMARSPGAGLPIYFLGGEEYDPALRSQRPGLIVGSISPTEEKSFARDIKSLPSGRDWIVLSHHSKEVEDFYISHLDRIGSRLATYRRPGATVLLYRIN